MHFLVSSSTWMLKRNFELRTILKCSWWGHVAITLLLNVTGGCVHLFDFREKTTSFACYFRSGSNCIFHWYAQFLINSKSRFRVFWEFVAPMIFEKSKESWAKNSHIDIIPSGKSFIYIKNKRESETDPEVQQSLFFSSLNVNHLKQPFVFDHSNKDSN